MPRKIGYGQNLTHVLEIIELIQPCTREQVHAESDDLTLAETGVYLGRAVRYGLADRREDDLYITAYGWQEVVGKAKTAPKEQAEKSVWNWK